MTSTGFSLPVHYSSHECLCPPFKIWQRRWLGKSFKYDSLYQGEQIQHSWITFLHDDCLAFLVPEEWSVCPSPLITHKAKTALSWSYYNVISLQQTKDSSWVYSSFLSTPSQWQMGPKLEKKKPWRQRNECLLYGSRAARHKGYLAVVEEESQPFSIIVANLKKTYTRVEEPYKAPI